MSPTVHAYYIITLCYDVSLPSPPQLFPLLTTNPLLTVKLQHFAYMQYWITVLCAYVNTMALQI